MTIQQCNATICVLMSWKGLEKRTLPPKTPRDIEGVLVPVSMRDWSGKVSFPKKEVFQGDTCPRRTHSEKENQNIPGGLHEPREERGDPRSLRRPRHKRKQRVTFCSPGKH